MEDEQQANSEQDCCTSFDLNVKDKDDEGHLNELESHIGKRDANPIDPKVEEEIRGNRGAKLLGISDNWAEEAPLSLNVLLERDTESTSHSEDEIESSNKLNKFSVKNLLRRESLMKFKQVISDHDNFVTNFMTNKEALFEEDSKAKLTGSGDGDTNEEELACEKQKRSDTVHDKFLQLCEFEDNCFTNITSEALKKSLKQKYSRVQDLQKKEKEEIAILHEQINQHLNLETKMAELNKFEESLQSMDADIKEMSRTLQKYISFSIPEIGNTFGNISVENLTLTQDLPLESDSSKWETNWSVKDDGITLRQIMDEETSSASGIFSSLHHKDSVAGSNEVEVQPCNDRLRLQEENEDNGMD